MSSTIRRVVMIGSLLLLVPSHGLGLGAEDEFEFPDTPPGQIARAWLAAYESQDRAEMSDFHTRFRTPSSLARRSVEARADEYEQIYEMMGPLTPHSIVDASAGGLSMVVESKRAGGWFLVFFIVQDELPYKLVSMGIQLSAPPEGVAVEKIEWSTLEDLLEQLRADAGVPAMAAAYLLEGEIVEVAAVGTRQIDGQEDVQPSDRFHIGSVGKSFTATMIDAIVELGWLRYDITVGESFKDLPMRDEYREVTLLELLRHRGRLQSYTHFSEAEEKRLDALEGTPAQQRRAFLAEVLMDEPLAADGDWSYSNAGYTLAAHMAEVAAGESYEELMQRHVFEPLDMVNAGFGWPATPSRPEQPRGHTGAPGAFVAQPLDAMAVGDYLAPAGDIHASILDLASYARAHLLGLMGREGPFPVASVRRLHEAPRDDGPRYASGWLIRTSRSGDEIHEHAGSAGSFYARIELNPARGSGFVVVMNAGALSLESVAQGLAGSLREGPGPP